jgi:glycosyltransferase involved in cell wall biosynthesis
MPGDAAHAAARPGAKRTVFITKFSRSPKTAIGLQTSHLMAAFPDATHLYWATPKHYPDSRSDRRLENAVIARVGRLQRKTRLPIAVRNVLSWWKNDQLRPRHHGLIRTLAETAGAVYFAPIDGDDTRRMRFLAERIGRPYVLHLWDSLSGPLANDEDLVWLIRNARSVLTLSRPLRDEVEALGARAEELLFTRPPSQVTASPPVRGGVVRIALLGLVDPYPDGVRALIGALAILRERGVAAEIVYIGPKKSVRRINRRWGTGLQASGFLSDEERDDRLARCHIGFLPGPSADPADDMRSRYSIPSRVLDLLATGLPLVGTVHADSATGQFLDRLGLTDRTLCADAGQVAQSVIELVEHRPVWTRSQQGSVAAFDLLRADPPSSRLRHLLRQD